MEINLYDYREILQYLIAKRWEGMEFVVFRNGNGPLSKEDLTLFDDHKDAQQYCTSISTDQREYDCLSIRSVYRTMQEAVCDRSRLKAVNGIVDISAMVQAHYDRLKQVNIFKTDKKEEMMNERNAEYLANQLFYTGFGGIPKDKLHAKLKEGNPEFQLVHDVKYGQDSVRAKLNFRMSEQSQGMYFFNSFDLLLKKQNKEETLQMNFPVRKGTFTLKEGYNLLDGRSVHKNFVRVDRDDKNITQEYTAWTHLDFKDLDTNGLPTMKKTFDYDLEKKLDEYPIVGLETDQIKKQVMDSLKRGNIHGITVKTSRGEEAMRIEASPRFDTINFYNDKMKPVVIKSIGESKSQDQDQAMDKVQSKEQVEKQEKTHEMGENAPKRTKSRKLA